MVLKIRLARFGKRNAPFYNIVVTQARTARNSKPLEVLGTSPPTESPSSTSPNPLSPQCLNHWCINTHGADVDT